MRIIARKGSKILAANLFSTGMSWQLFGSPTCWCISKLEGSLILKARRPPDVDLFLAKVRTFIKSTINKSSFNKSDHRGRYFLAVPLS